MTDHDDPSWTNAMHAQVCVVPTRDKIDSHVFLQNKCSLFTLSIAQQIPLSLSISFSLSVSHFLSSISLFHSLVSTQVFQAVLSNTLKTD